MARGKGEGSIYQDGELWRASVELPPTVVDGKLKRRRKVISSKSKSVVISKLRALQKDKDTYGDLSTRSITFGAWVQRWLSDIAPEHVRPKTMAGYRSAMKVQLLPRLEKKRLDRITPAVLRETLDDAAEAGVKDSYIAQLYGVMSACFRDAVNEGLISESPTKRMRPPRAERHEAQGFTLEEALKVLKHAMQDKELGALWCTYLLTGVRRSEGMALEVDRIGDDRIDLSWQVMHIKPEDYAKVLKDYKTEPLWSSWYLAQMKSDSGARVIPSVEPLRTILADHISRHQPTRLLFTRDGERTLAPDKVNKAWNEMVADAGVQRRVTIHGARHTVVDLLYLAGVPELVIMEILGHSNISQTRAYRTKRKELSPQAQKAMEQMSDLFDLGEHSPAELERS